MQPLVEYSPKAKRKFKSKNTLANETRKTIKSLIVTLAIMIVVLSGFFLGITSRTAQKGYTLQQAKLENEELKDQSESINAKILNSTAVSKIDEEEIDHMEEVTIKDYLTKEDNLVN
jgi:hypothetical protein